MGDVHIIVFFFFQAEDGIRDVAVTGVQTCALPISNGGWRDGALRAEAPEGSPLAKGDWEPFMYAAAQGRPRLCFVGPMVGRNAGYVTTQGEILADHFRAAGYEVTSVSSAANRYARLLDIATTLVRCRRHAELVLIQVFGGPS